MNTYKITMTVDRNQLLRFIDLIGLDQNVSVEALVHETDEPEQEPAPAHRRGSRGPRGSKVNDAIMRRLRSGEQTTKELKSALEADGLAPASLSTGLAILQRRGQIERIGDGVYALKLAKAAE